MKSFKQYLNENREQCGIKFGKVLFGEFLKRKEKDTKYEKDTFEEIVTWIENGVIYKNLINVLNQLKKCKTYYPSVLKPKKVQTMFRAIVENNNYMSEKMKQFLLNESNISITNKKDNSTYLTISGFNYYEKNNDIICLGYENQTYKPAKKVESWSDNELSHYIQQKLFYSVVWECPVKEDEFVFNSAFLNKVGKEKVWFDHPEHEVIRVSDKSIKGIMWLCFDKSTLEDELEYNLDEYIKNKLNALRFNLIFDKIDNKGLHFRIDYRG